MFQSFPELTLAVILPNSKKASCFSSTLNPKQLITYTHKHTKNAHFIPFSCIQSSKKILMICLEANVSFSAGRKYKMNLKAPLGRKTVTSVSFAGGNWSQRKTPKRRGIWIGNRKKENKTMAFHPQSCLCFETSSSSNSKRKKLPFLWMIRKLTRKV